MSNESENMEDERKKRRTCSDCGCSMSGVSKRSRPMSKSGLRQDGVNMHYMLKTSLWFEINNGFRGLLCLICAQIRLGRKFIPTDFKAVPLNFRRNGALATLFPDEFTAHMVEFVGEETKQERLEGRLLIDAHFESLKPLETHFEAVDFAEEVSEQDKILKSETKPKTKPKKKTNTSKSTKKAMSALKKNKKAYTGAVYGWDVKQGSLVPNWKEQNNIDWMKFQVKYDVAGAVIAKTLNENGLTGKKGGKWTSTSVLRTIRNELHSTRNDDEAPRWFIRRGGKSLKK